MMRRPEDTPAWRALTEAQADQRSTPPRRPQYEPAPSSPPDDKLLATLERRGGYGKRPSQVRLSLRSLNGSAFFVAQPWELGRDGASWFPVKGASFTFRRNELAATIRALTAAARELGVEVGGEEADHAP